MSKHKKIDSYFKRKPSDKDNEDDIASISLPQQNSSFGQVVQPDQQPSKVQKVSIGEYDINSLECDPGKRPQIWEYPVNQRDEIRRAYLNWGPYQCDVEDYPLNKDKNPRRFQSTWLKMFPSWLEYSIVNDAAYCLPCYLFSNKPSAQAGSDVFTRKGFRAWKKVNAGKNCAFLIHLGGSPHNNAIKACFDLLNQSGHIRNIFNVQSSDQIKQNRLHLRSSIDSIPGSLFKLVLLEVTMKRHNQKIEKEIMHIMSSKVRRYIRDEIGDSKFCIVIDESCDESQREQMAIVLRFVDKNGYIQERFFDIVHVKETTSITLQKAICGVLSQHNLDVSNIRGQGYDGASNMRGEWNGLQALFLKDCSHAYYVHCFAHRLQLALVAASREVIVVHEFFSKLTFIVNIMCSSSKRHDELQAVKSAELEHLLEIDELITGKGENQIGTLKRVGDTRWSSHFSSICSLINMYNATCVVLLKIIDNGSSSLKRVDADMMKEIMGITDCLCQALQLKSQDIVNAMQLVRTTKELIQKLRDSGWQSLLKTVTLFCEQHDIYIPDFNNAYIAREGRARHQKDHITFEHHYRVNIFLTTIDKQLQVLNPRFSEQTMELLTLSTSLDPKDVYKTFNIENIYLKNISTISELSAALTKVNAYYLLDRVIRLILTLPVSTATTERSFSTMKIIKTRLRSKMEDEFLADNMVIYIEKEIAETFTSDSIIDEFKSLKERRAAL
ncbi:PREDICTED: zinc finger MYM-type protein 1-like [Lupinus angustifolius]|uniref:zinc finger MYM-type protein 1-like n=1 Tax=Lupinus angustifolius TaxID=3871 RepID=UPI00092F5564|nr:PREDICTED: zinc finger MYM-type protein 1-like [Lupinus angustifolius]